MSERTTVWVSDDTWDRLDELKERGQTMDEVINAGLDALEEQPAEEIV